MNNSDIIMVPVSSKQLLAVHETTAINKNAMTSFGKNIQDQDTKPLLSNQHKSHNSEKDKVHKSLKKMSCKLSNKQNISSLVHVAYYSLSDTRILIASIAKEKIFNFAVGVDEAIIDDYKVKIPLNKFICNSTNFLLSIPETSKTLETSTKQKIHTIYNYCREDPTINKQKLHIQKDSMIYTNGDISKLSLVLMDLTSNWSNSLCVYSTEDLMTISNLKELKKNNSLHSLLDNCSLQDSYSFSIFVNSVMPKLKNTKYLNFFNVSQNDLEKIDIRNLKMIDIKQVLSE